MTYTDRHLRNIVIFAVVAGGLALATGGAGVTAVLCMADAHHRAGVSVPSSTAR